MAAAAATGDDTNTSDGSSVRTGRRAGAGGKWHSPELAEDGSSGCGGGEGAEPVMSIGAVTKAGGVTVLVLTVVVVVVVVVPLTAPSDEVCRLRGEVLSGRPSAGATSAVAAPE